MRGVIFDLYNIRGSLRSLHEVKSKIADFLSTYGQLFVDKNVSCLFTYGQLFVDKKSAVCLHKKFVYIRSAVFT